MSKYNKTTYLEREKQFWEITLDGKSTQVRAGKVNCKGRKFGMKCFKTEEEAAKSARILINGKIIEGFADPGDKAALKRSVSSFRLERKKSLQAKIDALPPPQQVYKMPHKKRGSIRKLNKQETLIINSSSSEGQNERTMGQNGSTAETRELDPAPKYRKPPRKQTTIRRNAKRMGTAKQSSLAQRLLKTQLNAKNSRTLSKMPTLVKETSRLPLSKAQTLQMSHPGSKTEKKKSNKTVSILDPKPSRRGGSSRMPALATQETMPVEDLNTGSLAQEVRVDRKCRSYSMSALPQTVVKRK